MRGRQRYRGWQWVVILFVLLLMGAEGFCKSVFAAASHGNGRIKAYKIESDYVYYQNTVSNTENFGNGATGLCVWPEFEKIFVCYESSAKIAWASTKTLTRQSNDEYTAPEEDLAGMAIDQTRQVMYVISRSGGRLYAFQYDPVNDTLVLYPPDNSSLTYRQLSGLEGCACYGIAFQTGSLLGGDFLYVADGTNIVRCYNTMTWQLVRQLDMKKQIIGLDVDEQRGVVYGGGHWNNNYLVRYNLNGDPYSPSMCTYVDMGFGVTDVKIDEDTGYLYMLTRRTDLGGLGSFEMYDPTQWTTDPNDLIHKDTEFDSDYSGEGPGGLGIGPTYKEQRGYIAKDDDTTSCVEPNEVFDYTIVYHAGPQNETNVVVTDTLPEGVDFVSADPDTGTYYPRPEHTYVWYLGDVPGWTPDPNAPTDPNYYFSLTVRVNTHAEPAANLENIVEAESDEALTKTKAYTPTCWWGGDIIYVKWDAAGADIGTDWTNAYRSLSKALARAAKAADPNAVEVRIAGGIYRPGDAITDSFQIPAGIEVYGGWLGDDAKPTERDVKRYETILSGLISDTLRNETVVAMGAGTLLDGVTVKESGKQFGDSHGVLGQNVDFTISNCIIKDNQRYGLRAENGNVSAKWCTISGNGYDGVRHIGNNSKTLTVENCRMLGNSRNGIYTETSSLTILNSVISSNGSDNSGTYYGAYVFYPSASPVIKNCSIVDNVHEGCYFVGFGTRYPSIRNCILWGNKDNGQQLEGYRTAYYSCIYDPNHPNQTTPDSTYHNISCEPVFAYGGQVEVGIYRLLAASPCIDKGDPGLSYSNQTDMDCENRVYGYYADMGADEACACDGTLTDDDIYNVYDWDDDGLVNLNEFSVFALAWLSHDPNDPAFNPNDASYNPNLSDPNHPDFVTEGQKAAWEPLCEFYADYEVNAADLDAWLTAAPWVWRACWRIDIAAAMQQQQQMMMSLPEQNSRQQLTAEQMTAVTIETPVPQIAVEIIPIEIPIPEKSIEEQLSDIKEAAKWLEELWLSEPELQNEINSASWKDFMDAVYESVNELEQLNMETLPESEELQ